VVEESWTIYLFSEVASQQRTNCEGPGTITEMSAQAAFLVGVPCRRGSALANFMTASSGGVWLENSNLDRGIAFGHG
jgi:hypothetical protein